jgi:uncharacterized protein
MSESRRILVSGGSGLIGQRLMSDLELSGHEVVQLVRREPTSTNQYRWDPYTGSIDPRALKGLDAVVHLSGAGIGAKRWTAERKRVIADSRLVTTRFLAEHLAALDDPPEVLISQSAIGVYGDRGDEILTEDSKAGADGDFLSDLTVAWEDAAEPARRGTIRVVHPRTGLVLADDAPLMQRLVPLFRAGLGGPIGDGRQWWSWVSLDDAVAALGHLIDSSLDGPVNLVAPEPVRQDEFARTLGAAVNRPALVHAPKLGVQLALGAERASSIAFSSARVVPERLMNDGFVHRDAELEPTLRRLVS